MSIVKSIESCPKVTVIIPVYEPGIFLKKCIVSVCSQTLKDIEIIIIDDCGNDGSMQLLSQMALQDSRIRIISNSKNEGAGVSRNKGIENAKGEYLAFVDADDYLASDFLELLYRKGREENAEIVKGNYVYVHNNVTDGTDGDHQIVRIESAIKEGRYLYEVFTNGHWSAIYKRKWLNKRKVRYGNSTFGEDTTFLLRACSQCRLFSMEPLALYYHVQNRDSMTAKISTYRLEQQRLSFEEQTDFLLNYWKRKISGKYFSNRAKWNLAIHAAAVRQSLPMVDTDRFLLSIRDQVMRVSSNRLDHILESEVRILVEFRENVGCIQAFPFEMIETSDVLDTVNRCFLFAEKHEESIDILKPLMEKCIKAAALYDHYLHKNQMKEKEIFEQRMKDMILGVRDSQYKLKLFFLMEQHFKF